MYTVEIIRSLLESIGDFFMSFQSICTVIENWANEGHLGESNAVNPKESALTDLFPRYNTSRKNIVTSGIVK